VIAKTPDFLELAGTVSVPAGKHATAWDDVLRSTRGERAGRGDADGVLSTPTC
jgi:antitoxin PrlF